MTRKYSQLHIIVRGGAISCDLADQDNYDTLTWHDFGTVRETSDGRTVRYQYHQSHNNVRRDVARAVVSSPRGVEAKAYLQNAYSEDMSIQSKLNRMLGIKLKRKRRK